MLYAKYFIDQIKIWEIFTSRDTLWELIFLPNSDTLWDTLSNRDTLQEVLCKIFTRKVLNLSVYI